MPIKQPNVLAILFLFVILSCKKKETPIPKVKPVAEDIYVTGSINSSTGLPIAVFWKNGELTFLGDSSTISCGNAIAVSGTDLYIAGYVASPNNVGGTVATYWKNGQAISLPNGNSAATANALAIVGNDVYIAGISGATNSTSETPAYWKNGVPAQTQSVSIFPGVSYINGIAADADNVYLCGVGFTAKDAEVPIYWKNGVATILTGNSSSEAFGIAVNNNDVYVAGVTTSTSNIAVATLWKNGVATMLSDGSSTAFALAIATSGRDVYAAGYDKLGSYGTYWKNGVATRLSGGPANANTIIRGITVSGSDVYATGSSLDLNSGMDVPLCWVNGTRIQLANRGSAYAIVVVPH